MSILLEKLPYDINALEPHISAETMSYHYDRHHRGYVDKLNRKIEGTPYEKLDLEAIIVRARKESDTGILNNALQAWNHTFLWESMSPNGGGKPEGRILDLVEEEFGSYDRFSEDFLDAATGLFGSGWVWLADDDEKLRIVATRNADSPVATDSTPLLVLDVWEHAYYIDYRNERKRYIETFLSQLVNWKFAAANLESAKSRRAA